MDVILFNSQMAKLRLGENLLAIPQLGHGQAQI